MYLLFWIHLFHLCIEFKYFFFWNVFIIFEFMYLLFLNSIDVFIIFNSFIYYFGIHGFITF